VGDFDRDGKEDLAVVSAGSGNVTIHFGDGTGDFRNPVSYPTGDSPFWIVAADLDHDGRARSRRDECGQECKATLTDGDVAVLMDVAMARSVPRRITAPVGTPSRLPSRISTAIPFWTWRSPTPVPDDVVLFQGRGDGAFAESARLPVGQEPIAIAAGDLNATRSSTSLS